MTNPRNEETDRFAPVLNFPAQLEREFGSVIRSTLPQQGRWPNVAETFREF